MSDCFWKNGLLFSCKQCSKCCRFDPGFVFLSEADLARLCSILGMAEECFIEKYCRWVCKSDGYEYLSLIEKQGYDCVFWDNGCTVYSARPLQCSAYPFWQSVLADKRIWEEVVSECPGAGEGKLVGPEKLLELRIKQAANPHIRRSF
ncbi:MAG: zinc/iron-chelating domain-containing protein [Treponema sp.]|nr:MAG: zinc/iron-chelating domain-containing protein [Treponema sp.]